MKKDPKFVKIVFRVSQKNCRCREIGDELAKKRTIPEAKIFLCLAGMTGSMRFGLRKSRNNNKRIYIRQLYAQQMGQYVVLFREL